jgi:hypothetical protein
MPAVGINPESRKRSRDGRKIQKVSHPVKYPIKKSFESRVKDVISRTAENKVLSLGLGLQSYNSGINAQSDVIQIIPASIQGTDAGSRVGNELTVKSFNIKGHYILSLANNQVSASCRIGVRILILQAKRYKSYYDANTQFVNHLPLMIRTGDSVRAFTGVISDLYLPINEEVYEVLYDKVQYVTMPFVATAVGANDVRNTVKMFDIDLKTNYKKLTYEDSLSNYPQNWGPFMAIGYAKMDGTAPDVAVNGISVESVCTMKYIDV